MSKKHWFGPYSKSSKGRGHPVLFGEPHPVNHFDSFPDGGGYPIGFVEWTMKIMGCENANDILHLFSGSVRTGLTLDARIECFPHVVADVLRAPFSSRSFDFILADPPYSFEYAKNLYRTQELYPSGSAIVNSASRLLRAGGKLGLLHIFTPFPNRYMKLKGVWGITTGVGYAIRAWSLFEKQPAQLEF